MTHPAHAPYSVAPLPYNPEQLYVVTAFYNPYQARSRSRHYRAFKKHMEDSGVKLMTVEIAFGDRPFEVTDPHDHWNVQLRTNVEMWHKERALNIGIDRIREIVPKAKYVAWIDADTTFVRSDWAHEAVQKLQHHPVIQLYGETINLNPDGHILFTASSCFRAFFWAGQKVQDGCFYEDRSKGGHPGLAWAATTEALDHLGGLMDFCISGSGDSHMANALMGEWDRGDHVNAFLTGFSTAFTDKIKAWGLKAADFHGNVGFVPGVIAHHWHGKPDGRGYPARWDILKYYQFDPDKDICLDSQGLYQYRGNKPKMDAAIKRSMLLRDEDGTAV
jgi:hypothetical protein